MINQQSWKVALMRRIFIAGHNGMVGSAIYQKLKKNDQVICVVKNSKDLDLTNQQQVKDFYANEKIDEVYLAAAKVGGIWANNEFPADFIYQNLMIEANIIHQAYHVGIKKLLYLGSSCIYPRLSPQPITESSLLTGDLESTNEPYAIAKIAGIKLCESYNRQYGCDYRSIMPTNLYGPNDNFHPENSHVIPALLRRIHEAKINNSPEVSIWGTGSPKREFLHVHDMADAAIYVMNLEKKIIKDATKPMRSHINIGTGQDYSIKHLVDLIIDVVGYRGKIIFDYTKPDGTPRKLLDVSLINSLGWHSTISFEDGLKHTYKWFLENQHNFRK